MLLGFLKCKNDRLLCRRFAREVHVLKLGILFNGLVYGACKDPIAVPHALSIRLRVVTRCAGIRQKQLLPVKVWSLGTSASDLILCFTIVFSVRLTELFGKTIVPDADGRFRDPKKCVLPQVSHMIVRK